MHPSLVGLQEMEYDINLKLWEMPWNMMKSGEFIVPAKMLTSVSYEAKTSILSETIPI